ncbi:MAG: hypothetical protein IJS32_07920, partial [Kiritimatiellae bacterium]|nr:hypothetical protein [Kiritimatiellia bacterium]
ENQVVTVTNTVWTMAGPNLSGFDNDWEWRGTATVTNGEGFFVDTGIPDHLGVMRFYAAAEANDTDGDGLTDGMERFVFHTDPTVPNNGNPDPSGTNATTNVFWFVTTTNEMHWWHWLGTNLPPQPQCITNFPIPGSRPTTNSVVQDVRITGFVDDILCVDGNVIGGWDAGTTNFTDISVFEQATNVQSGTLDLQIWDWPGPNHEGDNEAKLGYSHEEPFRVEWTWAVPMEFRLEHITTNGAPLVVNPSGTRPNREITCVATVLPANIPDSDIHWEVSGAGMTFAGGTNWGREVHNAGTSNGTWTATVTVSNSTLSPARLQGRVLEKKDVNVYLHIVCDNYWQNPAMTVEHFDELLAVANRIWEQAAIEFHRVGNVMYTNRTDWQVISTTDNWEQHNALQSWSRNTGGIEVYCINQFANSERLGLSCTNEDETAGLTIVGNALPRTLAHELGHACGLHDIYTNVDINISFNLYNEVVLKVCASDDWCEEAPNGGYGDLTLHPMICRLLMFGRDGTNRVAAVDIPAGRVYGLMQNGLNTSVAVGLNDMGTRNPKHW